MGLIKIYNGSLVNARELHKFFEIKTDFAHWIKRMLEYGFDKSKDYFTVSKKENRHIFKEYYLTVGAAKEIAMLQRNEKGREARRYFIKCEETLQELKHDKRFEAFLKLETTKEKLRQNVLNIGGTDDDFLQIDLSGRKILFNGHLIEDEVLNTVLLKGRDFAIAMTNGGMTQEGIKDIEQIEQLSEESHKDVRDAIIKNVGKTPEELPIEEKIKKLGE